MLSTDVSRDLAFFTGSFLPALPSLLQPAVDPMLVKSIYNRLGNPNIIPPRTVCLTLPVPRSLPLIPSGYSLSFYIPVTVLSYAVFLSDLTYSKHCSISSRVRPGSPLPHRTVRTQIFTCNMIPELPLSEPNSAA